MGVGGEYIIKYSGLKEGLHDFDFKVDDAFFEHFEYSEFDRGNVDVLVQLDRKTSMLVFDIEFNGHLTVPCDRCGEDVDVPLSGSDRLIIKFGDEEEQVDEILVLPYSEYEIDISKYIFEFVTLHAPAKRVHPEGECDPEALARIGQQLDEPDQEDKSDPRWSALKGLKFDE